MGRSATQYKNLLKSLLPRGRALTRAIDTTLDELFHALGEELSRVEGRAYDLVKESVVSTATELLPEYEEEFDLPLPGLELKTTIEGRRADILAKMISVGQQNRSYYEAIAEAMGYDIVFETFRPSRSGIIRAGDRLAEALSIFLWLVRVDLNGDKGAFGLGFSSEEVDCLAANDWAWAQSQTIFYTNLRQEFERIKLAESEVQFDYYGREFDRGFGYGFMSFPSYDGSIIPESFDSSFDTGFMNNYSYDGTYLIGGYDTGFNLAFNTHFGESFFKDEFGEGFARPQ